MRATGFNPESGENSHLKPDLCMYKKEGQGKDAFSFGEEGAGDDDKGVAEGKNEAASVRSTAADEGANSTSGTGKSEEVGEEACAGDAQLQEYEWVWFRRADILWENKTG